MRQTFEIIKEYNILFAIIEGEKEDIAEFVEDMTDKGYEIEELQDEYVKELYFGQ